MSRRHTFPYRFTVPLLLLIVILASACGASGGDDDSDSGMFVPAGSAGEPMPIATTAGGATAGGGTSAAPEQDGRVSDLTAQGDWNRMVIRSAQLTLSVHDVGGALGWVRNIAAGKGGFVFSSSSYVENERQYAQITIQVPVERFDETMNELRANELVDKVEREESTAQDVTAEFVDNESRLNALRETELRFLDLLGQAKTVDEILRLEYELNNVRTQIETIEGRNKYLESVTSFSTISVSLTPAGVPARPDTDGGSSFSLSSIVERAWEHSRGAIEGTLVATITLGIYAAAILPIAVVLFVLYRVGRGVAARRRTAAGANAG